MQSNILLKTENGKMRNSISASILSSINAAYLLDEKVYKISEEKSLINTDNYSQENSKADNDKN